MPASEQPDAGTSPACVAHGDSSAASEQPDAPFTPPFLGSRGHLILAPTLRSSVNGPTPTIAAIVDGAKTLVAKEPPIRILLVTAAGDEDVFLPVLDEDDTVVTRLPTFDDLGAYLPDTDVIVVADFWSAPDPLDAVGQEWQPLLEPFLDAGGIVVVFEAVVDLKPSPSYQLVSGLLPVQPRVLVSRGFPQAPIYHHRYGTEGPHSPIDAALQVDEVTALAVVAFTFDDPDATWLVDAQYFPEIVETGQFDDGPILIDKAFPPYRAAPHIADGVDDGGITYVQDKATLLYDSAVLAEAAQVQCLARPRNYGGNPVICGMGLPPLTGRMDIDLSALQPNIPWAVDLAAIGADGELLRAETIVAEPEQVVLAASFASCPVLSLYDSPALQSALCRLEKLDGPTPNLIDERSCFCGRPDRPFDACVPSTGLPGYDPRNLDLDGHYRITVQVRSRHCFDSEASIELDAHCPVWLEMSDPPGWLLEIGAAGETGFRFTLGFEPDGYRSIQCTVTEIFDSLYTVIQTWPCADLHASGLVVAHFVPPARPPGVVGYIAHVEVVDADGNSASADNFVYIDWK